MQTTPYENTLPSLIRDLRDEFTTLMRQEVALAKAEVKERGKLMAKDTIFIVIGAVLALAGFLFLLLALREALGVALVNAGAQVEVALWLAPLIIAFLVGIIGGALIVKGRTALSQHELTPRKSLESLREHRHWLKQKFART
jgi:uncharacterized integral membrane protein